MRSLLPTWGVALLLVGCGGGGGSAPPPPTFTVGGTVTGLSGTVVLQNNGGDNLSVAADGAFTFTNTLTAGSSYSITVLAQPPGQTCTVSWGSGTANANVAGIAISCAANQYTLGGTASGLIRPLVLQDNQGNNLTVAADGTFVFTATLTAGSAYAVTVLTPPAGEVCTASNGSGIANNNVTNIAVVCSVDSGAFFIPFTATGQISAPGGVYVGPYPPPTNGTNGLMVVASDAIGTAPIFLTRDITLAVGVPQQFTLAQNGVVTAAQPSSLVYLTRGVAGGDHLWAVDLAAGSALAPRQVSNLSGSFIAVPSCNYIEGFGNLTDPTSAFFVLSLPTDTTYLCGGGPASFQNRVIHLSDSSTTPPTPVPTFMGGLLMLYAPSGALAGIVAIDASGSLVFFTDETFTHSTVLMSNVNGFSVYQDLPVSQGATVSSAPGSAMILIRLPDLSETVYRVDYTGALSASLYGLRGTPSTYAVDALNYYFVDTPSSQADSTLRIIQVPKDGSTAGQVIYSEVETSLSPTIPPTPYLIGSTGTDLVWIRESYTDSTNTQVPGVVQALALGASGTTRTVGSVPTSFSAALVGNDVYITASGASSNLTYAPPQSSEILGLDGSVLQSLTGATAFADAASGVLIQVRGITDPGGLGGGSLFALDPSNPTAVSPPPLTLPNGSGLTLPTGTPVFALWPVAGTIANGFGSYQAGNVGMVYDASAHEVVPISLPYTNVQPVTVGN
jgi:hypothetical protein